MKKVFAIIGATVGIVALLFMAPLIGLAIGMIFGWALEIVAGNYVADGLNLLLGTDRFSAEMLPKIFGVVGAFSSVFGAKFSTKRDSE
jgi:cation transporter-like permease